MEIGNNILQGQFIFDHQPSAEIQEQMASFVATTLDNYALLFGVAFKWEPEKGTVYPAQVAKPAKKK